MPMHIKYTAECECGGTMVCRELNLTQEAGDEVEITIEGIGTLSNRVVAP